jgi:hypothetical protein
MTARHWEALDLLARATGATASTVLMALVEQATVEAGQAIEAAGVAHQDAGR